MKNIVPIGILALAATSFAEGPVTADRPGTMLDASKPLAAPMQWRNQDQGLFGVSVGWYFPTNGLIRDRFGNKVFDVGFSAPFQGVQNQGGQQSSTSFGIISAEKSGDRMMIIPATFGIMKMTGGRGEGTKPYVAARAGVAYFDYRVTDPDTASRRSGRKFNFTANVEGGLILNQNLRLAAKYNWFPKVDGFDFSGIEVKLSYQFFRL